MLEQRIETLDDQVAKLTAAIEKLTALLASGLTPPPIAQENAIAVTKQSKAAGQSSRQTQPRKIEEVQKALVNLTHTHGREAALSVLKRFSGANKVGDLQQDQYADVIAAAENYPQVEAA